MSFKNGFADIPFFDISNWLSWSTRMSQFLMANKVWSYVIGTYTKPALIREMIPVPTFIPKALPAAIATKPIPCQYTSSTETRSGIWVNAEKSRDLADHMDVTPMASTLKCLETHVYNIVHLPQDHSLKQQMPSPDFVFTEDNFPYLLGSRTPSKRQHTNDGTIAWQLNAATRLCWGL